MNEKEEIASAVSYAWGGCGEARSTLLEKVDMDMDVLKKKVVRG